MIGTILQPSYIGWLGYWDMVLRSDVWVIFDSPQFERKSWQQRNRLKQSGDKPLWLSIPTCHGPRTQRICDVLLDDSQPWAAKHWRAILQAYAKAPYKEILRPLERLYCPPPSGRLAEFTINVLMTLAEYLGVTAKVVLSSQLPDIRPCRDETVIDICQRVGIATLLDAAGAEAILDPKPFAEAGIRLVFQKYEHPVYRQLHGAFVPFMSALDLLMNEGPRAREIILSGGQP